MPTYPKIPFDAREYEQEVRTASAAGSCFICSSSSVEFIEEAAPATVSARECR